MSEQPKDFLTLSNQALDDLRKMDEADVSIRSLYNRLYYAVFYSVKSLLVMEGITPKTHRGTASQFYQEIYRKYDYFSKEEAIILQRLQEKRDMADYELEAHFEREEFDETFSKAKKLIEKIEKLVKEENI